MLRSSVSAGLSVITDGIEPILCRKSLCHPPLYCLCIPSDQFKMEQTTPLGSHLKSMLILLQRDQLGPINCSDCHMLS